MIFTHRPRVSLAWFTFCWQWPDNGDTVTWIMIPDSLDTDFIQGNIHGRSCKKYIHYHFSILTWCENLKTVFMEDNINACLRRRLDFIFPMICDRRSKDIVNHGLYPVIPEYRGFSTSRVKVYRYAIQWFVHRCIKLTVNQKAIYCHIHQLAIQSQQQWAKIIGATNDQCIQDVANSLAPGRFEWNFANVIFKLISVNDAWGISCETTVR